MTKQQIKTPPGGIEHFDGSYECFSCTDYNVLLVGDSGAGKTTFIEYVRNLNYFNKEISLIRSTKEPISHKVLLRHQGKFFMINFIDTPGLNELGGGSKRGNERILEIISEFVRKDITKIHMVLITINAANRMTRDQLSTIEQLLEELGPEFKKVNALLVTNCEEKSHEDEVNYIKLMDDDEFDIIKMACQAGVLFSGAMSESQFKQVNLRDKFISKQKLRVEKFIHELLKMNPVDLINDKISKINSRFKSLESIMRDYMTAARLGPEIKEMRKSIMESRLRLSKTIEVDPEESGGPISKLIEEASMVGDLSKEVKTTISDEAVVKMNSHIEEAKRVSEGVENLKKENDVLIKLHNDVKRMERRLKLK